MSQLYLEEYILHKIVHKETRTVRRQFLEFIKEKLPCTDCKEFYPPYLMQFDHINDNKKGNVTDIARNGSAEDLMKEIMKCELVCANCHSRRGWLRSKGFDITVPQ